MTILQTTNIRTPNRATAAAIALGIVPGGKLANKLGLGKIGGFLNEKEDLS